MEIDVQRVERRRERRIRTNRAHIRAYLDGVRYNDADMDEPDDARAMRPHIFGDDE